MLTQKVTAASTEAASSQSQKSVIESCIRDMENICQNIRDLYPAIDNMPSSRLNDTEGCASDFIESILASFVPAGNLLTTIIRKEAHDE